MSDDDKRHEYVPQIVTETMSARLQMPVLRERLAAMTAERNNLAEAVREVNARLVEVTAERDAARQSRKRLVALVAHYKEVIEICDHEFDFVIQERSSWRARAEQAEGERDWWRARAEKCEAAYSPPQVMGYMEDDGR